MRVVICPICGRRIDWKKAPVYRIGTDLMPELLVRDDQDDEQTWQDQLIRAYRPCREVGQPDTHMLPYNYGSYIPVTIGMVGRSKAGKTHLLAAMIARLCSNDPVLEEIGLEVEALDQLAHRRYMADCVEPLITRQKELPGTPPAARVDFCDALKVTNTRTGQTFAVTFFDLAGERLERPNEHEARFFSQARALIFVVDPESLPRSAGSPTAGEASFDVALHRLGARPRPPGAERFIPVASATVVAKADLIRFEDRLASDWLAAGSGEEEIELSTVERESEDVYTYLTHRGAGPWLRPAQVCFRSTLHFASATNCSASEQAFHGAFRQCRVLKPLLAVFAMTGILDQSILLRRSEEAT